MQFFNPDDGFSAEADLSETLSASEEEQLRLRRREASLAALAAVRARRAQAAAADRSGWRRSSEPPRPPSAASVRQSSSLPQSVTVTEALSKLKGAVSGVLSGIWIAGEVSGYYRSAAGHVYFKLKDATGLLGCVAFAGMLRSRPADFRDGDRIEVSGRADVYARGGDLQLQVLDWRPAGLGSLYEAFLRLKRKLEREGLFAAARKKPVPRFVRRIGVVTSAQAAAWQDVRRTLERRTPWIRCELFEAPVQGDAAPDGIVRALRAADERMLDVILLVRGGGSLEDLQAYNDERVARALAAMTTPVICGVGHESDVTIADFVADCRASTPTAAAEAVGPDGRHWRAVLERLESVLDDAFRRQLRDAAQRVDRAAYLLQRPELVVAPADRRLDRIAERLAFVFGQRAALWSARVEHAGERLSSPDAVLEAKARRLARAADWQRDAGRAALDRAEGRWAQARRAWPDPMALIRTLDARLDAAQKTLAALDPDRPLRDGWIRADKAGGMVTRAAELSAGERLALTFADGRAEVLVEQVETNSII